MSAESTSLGKLLFRMTWPMMVGLLAILSCQLVDSAFIGQLGVMSLAAVGFSIPIYQLIIGLQVGIGVAITAIISTALGAGRHHYAKSFGLQIVTVGGGLLLLVTVALWLFQESIVSLLGASETLYPLIRIYWFPWLISCWLGAILHIGYSLFRAHGNTFLPGMLMVLTSVINALLDPLFIFVFDWGLAGAAWATCAAFSTGVIILFWRLWQLDLILVLLKLNVMMRGLRKLLSFMASATFCQFLPPMSAMIATSLVASHGDRAIAAWGLGFRVEFIAMILVLSLTMTIPPIIGQLRGQGDIERIHQLIGLTLKVIMGGQLVIAGILMVCAGGLARFLSADMGTAMIISQYLFWIPISFGALGSCMIIVSACNAAGMPQLALWVSLLRLFGCYLPLLWLGSELAGLNGLLMGAMVGNFLAGLMSWYVYRIHFTALLSGSKSTSSNANRFAAHSR